MTDLAMIEQAATVLFAPGSVVELRVIHTPKQTVSGYFDNLSAFAPAAEYWSGKAPGVYATLNPCTPALLARASNRMREYAKTTTADKEISQRVWLPLDFDPVRPADISSTDPEHEAALDRAEACTAWLHGRGWPAPVTADSGNGGHRLYRIDLPNDDATRVLLQKCLEALALHFSDGAVALDVSVFNAARIWKVYGTLACKGDHTPERPHRLSRLLDVPSVMACVTPQQLAELAALVPVPPVPAPRRGSSQTAPFDLVQWIATHGLSVVAEGAWQHGYRWVLNPCPWDSAHANKAAFIVQLANGAIAAGRHHNGCQGRNWHALRDLYEPGWQTRPAPARLHVGSNGASVSIATASFTVPGQAAAQGLSSVDAATQAAAALITRLATLPEGEQEEAILDTLPDLITLDTVAWMRLKPKLKASVNTLNLNDLEKARNELRRAATQQNTGPMSGNSEAQIAAALAQGYTGQLAYDLSRQAWMTYGEGLWRPLDTELVRRQIACFMDEHLWGQYTARALSGVEHILRTRLAQTLTLETPGWLPFRNGALDLVTMTLHDHSPDRPFTWQLPHSYDPQATCPQTQAWLHETVGQHHDQVQVLRAYAKAVITRRVDLQRYLENIGPGGTGKGTYTRLLQALVGVENTFATELKHLETNRFELSNLRGKVLMVVTDAERYSGPVNQLKAITGEDFVRMEEKFKAQRTEIAPVMVVISANEAIQSADYTSGLVRRRLSMVFRHRPTTPRDLLAWKDGAWHGELAAEIPGILNWVLAFPDAHMAALLQQTTETVPSLTATVALSLVETNPLAEWANQALLRDDRKDAQGSPCAVNVGRAHKLDRTNDYEHQETWLYPNYCGWIDDTGGKRLSSRRFTGLLKDLFENQLRLEGVTHTDDNKGSRFWGIRLRAHSDADEPLLITSNPAPVTGGTGTVTPQTRTSDGWDTCDAFLQSLSIDPPTPCPGVPSSTARGVGVPMGRTGNNPSLVSHPSLARGSGVTALVPPVTEPFSAPCAVGDCVFVLAKDGAIQNQNGVPYVITSIARGPDGLDYALFRESASGWPLAQCERALNGTVYASLPGLVSSLTCSRGGPHNYMPMVDGRRCVRCNALEGALSV